MFIKSVVNENKSGCYYNIFLEKGSCENKSNTRFFLNGFLHILIAIFR